MSYAVAINSSGQATIPKAVRDLLGVVPGENRLTFDIVDGKVILGKEPSRRELLEASLERIWARNEAEMRKHPEIREAIERHKNMTYEEIMDEYYESPEGKKEIKEKYGIEI